MGSIYDTDLDQNAANHVPLSPISFLTRTARAYPEKLAVIHGDIRRTWGEVYERSKRLASALSKRGIKKGDTVAVMAPNIPAFVDAHFGVPMSGAVLNALNIRLDADAIAFILKHGEAKVILVDREFSAVIAQAVETLETKPLIIDIDDPLAEHGELIGEIEYEAFLKQGDPDFEFHRADDEWDAIALNYTSGTTGDPKGVVTHHRGAYLNALGNAMEWDLPHFPVYLWTLPMFHCNGWCFPWTLAAKAGVNVCLRKVEPYAILSAIAEHTVTHLCGAPIVMSMMIQLPETERPGFDHPVAMMTAGASPPATVISGMEGMGVTVTHTYGLTEVYGPSIACAWKPEWDALPLKERARLKARQGLPYITQEDLMVANPETLEPLPWDGESLGEIMIRGNAVMKGYLKNPATTQKSFKGGWFHTGDLAVTHPDGHVEIKDRSKDIIISGGENISSVEVEDVLYSHPDVAAAAVVAKPDAKWGETPCAFIELKTGATVSETDIIAFAREHLAHFKAPRIVVFGELPKTATGKIQKFVLRDQAREMG
ncbi:acyl-CoA synthetase [Oceanicaulis sp.]|uniref:acyl-CoA synthetase n=1 Tax=Oceanicaulis sp. TaxID=1924941 RepID=UPI003BAA840E